MSLFSKVKTPTVSAAFLAAALAFSPAATAQPQPQPQPSEPADPEAVEEDKPGVEQEIGSHFLVIGAIKDPASAGIPAAPEDETVPTLPVVYEDEADTAKVSPPAGAVLPASPAR
jgi:hypothetical protein